MLIGHDFAQAERAAIINNTPDFVIQQKRRAAIDYLGTNWTAHPEYKPVARHSTLPMEWIPNATLAPIQMQARKAGRI